MDTNMGLEQVRKFARQVNADLAAQPGPSARLAPQAGKRRAAMLDGGQPGPMGDVRALARQRVMRTPSSTAF